MEIKKTRIIPVLLAAFFLASLKTAAQAPGVLGYSTACAIVDGTAADGYVINQSQDTEQVNGQVQFVFSAENSMARPAITTIVDVLVPPGVSVRVAHVKLAFQPSAAESCRFEVKDSIRKVPR